MIKDFNSLLDNCEDQFINYLLVNLQYNCFRHKQVIQTANYNCDSVILISKGAVYVSEPTSFNEPILVYGKGAVINLYNVILKDKLNFNYVAIKDSTFEVLPSDEIFFDYNKRID